MSTNKKSGFGTGIGSSSLLLIFVILCLVSFAALSIVSSYADKRLGEKISEREKNYYAACVKAEKSIADIDRSLRDEYPEAASKDEYFDKVGTSVKFTENISDLQELEVELQILYPEKSGEPYLHISKYCVVNKSSIEYDSTLHVIK